MADGDGETGFVVTAGDERFTSSQVVVATGTQQGPHLPDFAGQLDPSIWQLHSSDYRNPRQLKGGECWWSGPATRAQRSR